MKYLPVLPGVIATRCLIRSHSDEVGILNRCDASLYVIVPFCTAAMAWSTSASVYFFLPPFGRGILRSING